MNNRPYYNLSEETHKALYRDHGIETTDISFDRTDTSQHVVRYDQEPPHQKFGQPLPSPLHSPVTTPSRQVAYESPKKQQNQKNMSNRSSRTNSEEDLHRSVAISVLRDSGTKVEIMLKAHGLRKKKSLLNSLVTVFKKPHQPSRLLANGRFSEFELKENSIRFVLAVQTDKKKKKGNGNRIDTFVCDVKQFPTPINPESAEFEVLEPASGEAFILLSMIKVGNVGVNWKEFLDSNGTIDVTCI